MSHNNHKKKIIVALSGGVDSAVAAALLVEDGYDVEGVFMKNWSGEEFGVENDCPWEQDQKDAEAVCKTLGIPFKSVNFEKQYRDIVVKYFFDEYSKGRTPNPDIMCNKEIKFKLFLEFAQKNGAEYIATGHYARIKTARGKFTLLKGIDKNKDQSYFLHRLTPDQLGKTFFPVGNYKKDEVRSFAKKFDLTIADKKDSQGICFIGKINVQAFLKKNIASKTGNIIDIDTGSVVGRHDGAVYYTIGQREGLRIGGAGEPYFVLSKNVEKNIIYVGKGKSHPALFSKSVKFEDLHLIDKDYVISDKISASIRYRQNPASGIIDVKNEVFDFDQVQRAATPGQSIVFYDQDVCLGGGIITEQS